MSQTQTRYTGRSYLINHIQQMHTDKGDIKNEKQTQIAILSSESHKKIAGWNGYVLNRNHSSALSLVS